MKQYKNIQEVPKKYLFDLESILENETFENWLSKYQEILDLQIAIKDSKYDTLDAYLEGLKLNEKGALISNKISNYLSNNSNRELNNPLFKELENKVQQINEKFDEKFGSETVRFYKNIEKIKVWINDPKLANYRVSLNQDIENYNHKLDDKIEEFLVKTESSTPNYEEPFVLLTDSETDYGYVYDQKNKKLKLNPVSRIKFLKSDDAILRKNTVKQWKKATSQFKQTLANLLYQQFKGINVEAKLRNYNSAVSMLTSNDKVSDEVLNKLFTKVQSLKNEVHKYSQAFAKFYNLKFKEKFNKKYDSLRELTNVKSNYSVEDAQKLVLEALNPFGNEYMSIVNKAFNENWIDYMTIENKMSGAYSIGSTYGIDKKFILMNFDGQFGSVETLAHELGHSLHSYFSDTYNDLVNSKYPILLAEVASIFNEQMLYNHILKTSKNKELKFQILGSMIEGFFGTVVRQTQWAEYEYNLYAKIANFEVNSSYESISQLYYDVTKNYVYKPLKYNPNDLIASVSVPHFYYHFYVYKYAIGQLVANYFFAKYELEGEEYLQYYINNFLKKGGSDLPLKILENVGVNLLDDEFYEIGFKYIKKLIKQYIALGNEIFKK